MAMSGSVYTNVGGGYRLRLDWSATNNVAGNYSTITTNLYWLSYSQYYSISASQVNTGYSYIAGGYNSFSADAHLSANETRLLCNKVTNVNHAGDGTLTTSISANWAINVTLSGTYYGAISIPSTNITLDTIPRASVPTVSGIVDMGSLPGMTILGHRADTSFTHKFYYAFGTITKTPCRTYGALPYDNDLVWQIPITLANEVPSAVSGNGTIYCETYNASGTLIGTNTCSFITTVPASIVPTFTTLTVTELVTSVSTVMGAGKYIKGLSNIRFTASGGVGASGSSITSATIVFNGVSHVVSTAGIYDTGILSISGTPINYSAYVTDTRGRVSTSIGSTVSILDYAPPSISAFTVQRCDATGVVKELGTYLKIVRTATASSLVNSTEKNTISATIQYKLRSDTLWTTATSGTNPPSNPTGINVATSSSVATAVAGTTYIYGNDTPSPMFPITQAFDVKVSIVDKFNTTVSSIVVPVGATVMSWSQTGVGIGKVWERGALDVLGQSTFNNLDLSDMTSNSIYRQAIINGNFDIWQRMTSKSVTGALLQSYVADRWWTGIGGTTTTTVSRQAFALGQTAVPNNPNYYCRTATTSTTGQTTNYLSYCIEDVVTFSGQNVTLSFWAKADTNTRVISPTFQQNFGTGGSPSTNVTLTSQNATLTTSWARYSFTFAIPSVSGKVLGTTAKTDYLYMILAMPLNVASTIDIAQVQLNVGTSALPFLPKTFAQELQDCMRYYQKSYDYTLFAGATTGFGYEHTNTQADVSMPNAMPYKLQVIMMKPPTVTIYSPNNGASGFVYDASAPVNVGSALGQGITNRSFEVKFTAIAQNHTVIYHWVADADY